jgi:CAAX prenyl protease-like protein
VAARFVRLVVVVPLVEEIFWRGFLMRWLIDPDRPFTATPFGTYAPRAVALTTAAFMLAHAPSDWFGALVFGLAMAWLAVRTKSLAACVAMHAVANLALGVYVMATRSWGFW